MMNLCTGRPGYLAAARRLTRRWRRKTRPSAPSMFQIEVKRWLVNYRFPPSNGWKVTVDIDSMAISAVVALFAASVAGWLASSNLAFWLVLFGVGALQVASARRRSAQRMTFEEPSRTCQSGVYSGHAIHVGNKFTAGARRCTCSSRQAPSLLGSSCLRLGT